MHVLICTVHFQICIPQAAIPVLDINAVVRYIVLLMMGILMPETC
jgi:hypothetical protein